MSKRKGFNFYYSYFEVYQQLKTKDEKIQFIEAVLNKQFYGVDPKGLKGLVNFAYISQKHNIDKQVKGWEDKTGETLKKYDSSKLEDPKQDPTQGGRQDPTEQEEEEGQEKEKGKGVYKKFDHLMITREECNKLWDLGYTEDQINDTLEAIENYKENKKYKSLYLTAKKWLSKEPKSRLQENKTGRKKTRFEM